MRKAIRAFVDNVALALGTFVAHPMRTALTLLGIVIGVSTVMVMMALLTGLKTKVNKDMSFLGANVFSVTKWPNFNFGGDRTNWAKIMKRPTLTLEDRQAIREQCPSVLRVSASSSQPGQRVRTADRETLPNIFVVGSTADYTDTSGVSVAKGRFFSEAEEVGGSRVVVLGPDVADRLFPDEIAVGKEVRLKGVPFQVVGVAERRGKILFAFNLDNMLFIPISAFKAQYGLKRSASLNVQARAPELTQRAQDEATRLMRQRHGLKYEDENDFEISTNESANRSFNELAVVLTAATFGICILSLLVGGIGILNIMLVAVTERTVEIGIRKALGARRFRILSQFGMEAIVLSLTGGVIGVLLGFGLANLARWTFGLYAEVPTWAVLLSLSMSSGVGLVFGIYPAARAARLDPVEAMRSE
jgi:putative ABC transport system permease protein